jgi:hypothetical protein
MNDIATTVLLLALSTMSAAFLIISLLTGRIQPWGRSNPILRSETPAYFWACYSVFVVAFSAGIFMCLREVGKIWGFSG